MKAPLCFYSAESVLRTSAIEAFFVSNYQPQWAGKSRKESSRPGEFMEVCEYDTWHVHWMYSFLPFVNVVWTVDVSLSSDHLSSALNNF